MTASMSFLERLTRISQVGWYKNPAGRGYVVTWTQDGVSEIRIFRTAGAAQEYAAWLDTTGQQASVAEVRAAEKALRDLEAAVEDVEREEAEEALEDLESTMIGLGYRPAGHVPVVRHRRRTRRAQRNL